MYPKEVRKQIQKVKALPFNIDWAGIYLCSECGCNWYMHGNQLGSHIIYGRNTPITSPAETCTCTRSCIDVHNEAKQVFKKAIRIKIQSIKDEYKYATSEHSSAD